MAPPTRTIAGLMGPLIAAIGLSLVVGPGRFAAMVGALADDPAVVYVSGALLLVAGCATVRTHNVWAFRWPTIVTALGWLAIGGGLARMLFPQRTAMMAIAAVANEWTLAIGGLAAVALGGFLTLMSLKLEKRGA